MPKKKETKTNYGALFKEVLTWLVFGLVLFSFGLKAGLDWGLEHDAVGCNIVQEQETETQKLVIKQCVVVHNNGTWETYESFELTNKTDEMQDVYIPYEFPELKAELRF